MAHIELDEQATLRKVRSMLTEVKKYKLYGEARREIRMTTSYQQRFHGETNIIQRPVEELALDHLEDDRLKVAYEGLQIALGYLSDKERGVVENSYLEREPLVAEYLAERLHISVSTLRRLKVAAELKLAHMLDMEVFVFDEN